MKAKHFDIRARSQRFRVPSKRLRLTPPFSEDTPTVPPSADPLARLRYNTTPIGGGGGESRHTTRRGHANTGGHGSR